MKTFTFTALLLGAITGGFLSQAEAIPYGPCRSSTCCDNSSFSDGRLTVGADWLYWNLQAEALPVYAVTDLAPPGSTTVTATNQNRDVHYLNHNYKSGYRVNIGYEFPCSNWEFGANYSYIPGYASTGSVTLGEPTATSTQILEIPLPSTVATNSSNPRTPSFANTYNAHWKSNLSYMDLDLAHKVCFGECFTLHPHIGFRAAWGSQLYHGEAALDPTFMPIFFGIESGTLKGTIKQHFHGYGVEGGLWANWDVCWGFSLVGHVGGSILLSHYHVNTKTTENDVATDGLPITPIVVTTTSSANCGTPTVDYFVGLAYSYEMCETVINAHIGWEQHLFFNNVHLNFNHDLGNFSAQGLTLGMNIGF